MEAKDRAAGPGGGRGAGGASGATGASGASGGRDPSGEAAGGLETRAIALLRECDGPLAPLSELHQRLAAELGDEAGDAAGLHRRLAARPDLFLVLERAGPVLGCESWPAAERAAYEAALREAGWEGGALVLAAGAAAPGDDSPTAALAASLLAGSLAELASPPPSAAALRDRLAEALPLAAATMRVLAEAMKKG
jgi:hypothetical protein